MAIYNNVVFERYLQNIGAYKQSVQDSFKFVTHNSIPITPNRLNRYVNNITPETYMRAFDKNTVSKALNANVALQGRQFYANSPLLITKGNPNSIGEVMSRIDFTGTQYRVYTKGNKYPSYVGLNRLETSSVYTMASLSRQAVNNVLSFLDKTFIFLHSLYAVKVIGGFIIFNFDGTESILLDYFRTNNEPGVYRRYIDKHKKAIREGLLNEDFLESDVARRIKVFERDIADYKSKIAREPAERANLIKAFNDVGISYLIMFGSVKHAFAVYEAFYDFINTIAVGNKDVVLGNADYARVMLYSFLVQIDHGNRKSQKIAAFTSVCRKMFLTVKGTHKQVQAILLGGHRTCIAYDPESFHVYDIDLFYSKIDSSLGEYYKDKEGISYHAPFNTNPVNLTRLTHLLPANMLTTLTENLERESVTIEESATMRADIHTPSYNKKIGDGYSLVINESWLPYCETCAKGFRAINNLESTVERWNRWAGYEAKNFWSTVRESKLDITIVSLLSYEAGLALAGAASTTGIGATVAPGIIAGSTIGGPILYAHTVQKTLDNILIFNGQMNNIEKTITAERILFGDY